MANTLTINGFDFEPYLAERGIKWTRNDVDSPESGEMADGTMRRDRVIIRPTMNITLANSKFFIGDTLMHQMMSAIEPQWVDVTYFDPRAGGIVTRTFYSNNINVTLIRVENGVRRWEIDSFPLIAKGIAGDGKSNPE